ncbi:MAG: thioredoxin family protein [Rhizobiales bacterium]|jgi:thioredoxin-related protein|nr:thioredoxin family protein [Hyphomicrobiales bacterium]
MLSRRRLIGSVLAGSAAGVFYADMSRGARAEAILTEDGYYTEPWFLESFLELPDDLAEAKKKNKRLAIMWELRGCPYCKTTHLVNFAKPDISDFIRTHFEILQLNIVGSREVTDFDGEKLPEKRFAQKYGVRYTPTFQFFPDSVAGLAAKTPRDREVARAQGYLEPDKFLALFRSVAGHSDKGRSFDSDLKTSG